VIAQQIRDAFAAHGLDGTAYGLLCYDEWDDQFEPETTEIQTEFGLEEVPTGNLIKVRSAGNRWVSALTSAYSLRLHINAGAVTGSSGDYVPQVSNKWPSFGWVSYLVCCSLLFIHHSCHLINLSLLEFSSSPLCSALRGKFLRSQHNGSGSCGGIRRSLLGGINPIG